MCRSFGGCNVQYVQELLCKFQHYFSILFSSFDSSGVCAAIAYPPHNSRPLMDVVRYDASILNKFYLFN